MGSCIQAHARVYRSPGGDKGYVYPHFKCRIYVQMAALLFIVLDR